jgi:hypothetical protein
MVACRRERGAKKRAGDKSTHGAAEDRHARCRPGFARSSGKRCCGTASRRDEQACSANLALTMQYRGLEQTIALRLSNEDIGKLAIEAELREISLGQLVGRLIEAAMAQDLSRVLDKKPAEEPE